MAGATCGSLPFQNDTILSDLGAASAAEICYQKIDSDKVPAINSQVCHDAGPVNVAIDDQGMVIRAPIQCGNDQFLVVTQKKSQTASDKQSWLVWKMAPALSAQVVAPAASGRTAPVEPVPAALAQKGFSLTKDASGAETLNLPFKELRTISAKALNPKDKNTVPKFSKLTFQQNDQIVFIKFETTQGRVGAVRLDFQGQTGHATCTEMVNGKMVVVIDQDLVW